MGYKKQLEEQETISNSNIMRVKKFQRELESAENRAEEAESTLSQFRSRERVFASAFSSSQESSSALQQSSDVRAGSVAYSRAGSVARAGGSSSSYRASSMAASRAGSMSRN